MIRRFFVPGNPFPMPRQRFRVVLPSVAQIGRWCRMAPAALRAMISKATFVQPYPDKDAEHTKSLIARAYRDAVGDRAPWLGPIGVELVFVFARPKSMTRKHNYTEWKQTKPDVDNCEKCVLDALNKVAWKDDGQIAFLSTYKLIAGDQDDVGTTVTIWPMERVVSEPIEAIGKD